LEENMKKGLRRLTRKNLKLSEEKWRGELDKGHIQTLKSLTGDYGLEVALGELILLDGKWYVTHAGLLRLAQRRHCAGIRVQQVREFCDPLAGRWVFKATLYKRRGAQAFVGFGDADPSNVSYLVRGAEMRIAETRAVNRALRKAYGIGLCSVEELGSLSGSFSPARESKPAVKRPPEDDSNNGQPRLRDKLCLLIRQYNLDANLVKAYATDFCGTPTLRDANRDQIEAFIEELSKEAKENRDGLVCKLNSYAQSEEVRS
jgi:hypothetical protein